MRFVFPRALDEVRRHVRCHEGDAPPVAAFAEMGEEGGPFRVKVEEVGLAILVAEFGDGNYRPVGVVVSINEARETTPAIYARADA
jgi:hypothetical protein